MNSSQEFLHILARVKFASRYYELCASASVPIAERVKKISAKELLVAMQSYLKVRKERGPGIVFAFDDEELSKHDLEFAVVFSSYGCSFDPCLTYIPQSGERFGGNFPGLASDSAKLENVSPPNPPYPRPEFAHANELPVLVMRCLEIARDVARALPQK